MDSLASTRCALLAGFKVGRFLVCFQGCGGGGVPVPGADGGFLVSEGFPHNPGKWEVPLCGAGGVVGGLHRLLLPSVHMSPRATACNRLLPLSALAGGKLSTGGGGLGPFLREPLPCGMACLSWSDSGLSLERSFKKSPCTRVLGAGWVFLIGR